MPVFRRGPNQDAKPGLAEEQPKPAQNPECDPDQKQIVAGDGMSPDINRAVEPGHTRGKQVIGAPQAAGGILYDQDHAKGCKQLEQLGRLVYPAQQGGFDHRTDEPDGQRGNQQGQQIAPETVPHHADKTERDIGAQHIERPMGEVHHPRHPEHDRQSDRDQEQRGSTGQSGNCLGDDKAQHYLQRPNAALELQGLIRRDAAS